MKVIVIGKTDYKEKDTIVNAISNEGLISFKVRGSQVPNSHLAWINNPLTVAEVEYVENVRYRHQILKNATLLYSPLKDTSIERLLFVNLVVEVVNKMFMDEDKHLLFDLILDLFKVTDKANNFVIYELLFLANAIRLTGLEPEVNSCVLCGSKNDIVAFSFAEGGFICRKCLEPDMIIDLNPSQMRWIRYLFNHHDFKELADTSKFIKEDQIAILNKLQNYVLEANGVKLESIKEIKESI